MLAKPIMCFGERIHHKVVKEFLKSRNESKQLHKISLFFGSPTHAKATVISYSDYLNSPSHLVLQDNVAHKQPTYVSSGLQLLLMKPLLMAFLHRLSQFKAAHPRPGKC